MCPQLRWTVLRRLSFCLLQASQRNGWQRVRGTIAQIAFFNLTNAQSTAVAGANVTVPLETALPEGVKFKIDDKPAKAYPFSYCDSIGCHARLGFTAVELKWLQDGAVAKMATVPYRGNREPIVIDISLAGFTAGYKAMVDNNLAN